MKLDCVRNTLVKLVEKYDIEARAMYVQLVCLWHQWIHGCANSPLGQAPKTCAKLFIPPAKTTLPNNFQTMNISKLSGAGRKREKKSVTISGAVMVTVAHLLPLPAFILGQLKLCGGSSEASHWSVSGIRAFWLVETRWAPPNFGPV